MMSPCLRARPNLPVRAGRVWNCSPGRRDGIPPRLRDKPGSRCGQLEGNDLLPLPNGCATSAGLPVDPGRQIASRKGNHQRSQRLQFGTEDGDLQAASPSLFPTRRLATRREYLSTAPLMEPVLLIPVSAQVLDRGQGAGMDDFEGFREWASSI